MTLFHFQEQIETPSESAAMTPVMSQPEGALIGRNFNGEEEPPEEEITIEMPPPMGEIQTTLPLQNQASSQEDISSKLVCIYFYRTVFYFAAFLREWIAFISRRERQRLRRQIGLGK